MLIWTVALDGADLVLAQYTAAEGAAIAELILRGHEVRLWVRLALIELCFVALVHADSLTAIDYLLMEINWSDA